MNHRRKTLAAGLLLATMLAAPALHADTYPQRAIKIVVPYTPGGTNDVLARLIAPRLQAAWGQPVIVDNRPGAGGVIGQDLVAKSPADGHTLLLTITGLVQNATLLPHLPYDPYKDFTPITQLSTSANLLVVPKAMPATTLAEFVALVKQQPGRHSYGSYGAGTSAHILAALLSRQAGLDIVHTPYKGAVPMLNDLLGGHVSAAFLDLGTAREHVASGAIKVLGVTGPRRVAMAPDTPTMTEMGYQHFDPLGWFGIFAPGGMPAPLAEKISAEIRKAVLSPEISGRMEQMGQVRAATTPQAFAETVRRDGALYAKLIAELGIKLD
jgi:tripartite-type tricarboxylate transporter receptor subunit TctC